MQLFYEGKDITDHVDILKCIHRDVSCGRSDCLELELDHAASWYGWKPQQDDRISVVHNGYDTGVLVPEYDTPGTRAVPHPCHQHAQRSTAENAFRFPE